MDVKEEKNDDVKVDTKVTTTLAVKRPQPDDGEKVKVENDGEETKENKNGDIQTSQTTSTRRMSKRLRNR